MAAIIVGLKTKALLVLELRKKNRRNRKTEFCLDEIYFFELPSKQIYCIFI